MTECTREEIRSKAPGRREFVARFDGGEITSDAGGLLLGAVEERRGILKRFAGCFSDHRTPSRIEHTAQELVSQRVLAIALGYEDVIDHTELRHDSLLAALTGKADPTEPLAAPATLHRLELSHPELAAGDRYCKISLDPEAVDELLIDLFLETHDEPPAEVILDLDATDDPIHGKQEGRFFHGYYDCYCYLPLYIFAGDHLLCARLRTSDRDGAAGSLEELDRIVPRIRAAWPQTRIVVRGDSGFCREWLMAWCEKREGVEYVLGIARNERLSGVIEAELEEARQLHERSGKPERLFKSFDYRTLKSWSSSRRVVGKAEHLERGSNPRFVVTSFTEEEWDSRRLYEELYCARGEMENRIKEQQLDLFADRTSACVMRANQVRLYFSSLAYVLLSELRRIGLAGTKMARAQCGTIRLKLLKIGARVRVTVRKIWVAMSESWPHRELLLHAWHKLRAT